MLPKCNSHSKAKPNKYDFVVMTIACEIDAKPTLIERIKIKYWTEIDPFIRRNAVQCLPDRKLIYHIAASIALPTTIGVWCEVELFLIYRQLSILQKSHHMRLIIAHTTTL